MLSAVGFPLRYFWAPPPNTFVPWENLSPRTLLLFVQSPQLVYLRLAGLCYNMHPAPFIMFTSISARTYPHPPVYPIPARNLKPNPPDRRGNSLRFICGTGWILIASENSCVSQRERHGRTSVADSEAPLQLTYQSGSLIREMATTR